MQLEDYVRQVQQHLADAASLGDDSVQRIASGLAGAVGPAVQIAVMTALAEAAEEITALLLDVPTSPTVSVRLDGETVRTEVTPNPGEAPPDPRIEDGDATARISLRLSPELKSEVEAAATRAGVSVNTWLVRAAGAALHGHRADTRHAHASQRHITGFLNG